MLLFKLNISTFIQSSGKTAPPVMEEASIPTESQTVRLFSGSQHQLFMRPHLSYDTVPHLLLKSTILPPSSGWLERAGTRTSGKLVR